MITKDEVHLLNQEIRTSVLAGTYATAIGKLRTIYDLHIKDKPEHIKRSAIEEFIAHLRGIYGTSGKYAALAGIAFAEGLNLRLKDNQLTTLLHLGRSIFSGDGEPEKLLKIMQDEFEGLVTKNTLITNSYTPS